MDKHVESMTLAFVLLTAALLVVLFPSWFGLDAKSVIPPRFETEQTSPVDLERIHNILSSSTFDPPLTESERSSISIQVSKDLKVIRDLGASELAGASISELIRRARR